MTTEFTIGQHIGDYEILSILGLGGMGKVYKVRNVISDRIEAMKILLPDLTSQQGLADRFLREIRLLASLNHPNIASLRTALTYNNQLVMIMEFVDGETLANRMSRAPISTAEAVDYSDQVLSALSYAHKQNIIHRDIKPANMMLTPQGVVKLMDFGIARSANDGSLTSTGTTLGSLNYMPPEQVRGESADARSDIYSFGVSLYELLTGKLPFKGDSQYSLMTAHLNEAAEPPIKWRTDLPPSLNEIIMIAMAKDPAQRFQSADAFRAALKSVPVEAFSPSGTTLTPTPREPSSRRNARRNWCHACPFRQSAHKNAKACRSDTGRQTGGHSAARTACAFTERAASDGLAASFLRTGIVDRDRGPRRHRRDHRRWNLHSAQNVHTCRSQQVRLSVDNGYE